MIRQLQPTSETDRTDFEDWAQSIPQTTSFNWTFADLLEGFQKELCWGFWDRQVLHSVVCFLKPSVPLEILWLATRPGSENQGYMMHLMTEVIDNTLRQKALGAQEILLEVHEFNLKALKLYYSLGFLEVGRRKNYYKDGATAILMAKKVE